MLYMHDLWVNWFEGEENGYNVCRFHEWRKEDGIELIDQIPLLLVTEDMFNFIENDLQDLPPSFLQEIHRKTYMKKNQERHTVEYAAVVTDGQDVIVFDTLGYTLPVKKSRLIPRQERLVFEMVQGKKPKSYLIEESTKKEHHILSLEPAHMSGLTRRERQLKQLLMMALDQLKHSDHPEEVRYWLTEWDPGQYPYIKQLSIDEAWERLYEGTRNGWTPFHEDLCGKMVKGQAFFETIWQGENLDKSHHLNSQN
ncbi:YjbA family protein [Halobacillus yeomjeoni]|uniref:YjbA family protein n=1 Tax=Halobacillus yeomjeoni TaxID=311194 RepID=A0A931HS09_9BACI|nr:YjbA family protein [Halobacillus yeomjeoni]MBH0228785.1 YjbA family protein [Halobacillus yeomjeoni]MCA0983812.1 YjbA family protein [Halobacillus yeomjeoni]